METEHQLNLDDLWVPFIPFGLRHQTTDIGFSKVPSGEIPPVPAALGDLFRAKHEETSSS